MSGIEEIIEIIYNQLNVGFLKGTSFNTQKTRYETIQLILQHLERNVTELDGVGEWMVICDEALNPPDIIDNNQMVVKVNWRTTDRFDKRLYSVDLIFGNKIKKVSKDKRN